MKVEERSVRGSECTRGEGGEGRWVVGKKELRVEPVDPDELESVVRLVAGSLALAYGRERFDMTVDLRGDGLEVVSARVVYGG